MVNATVNELRKNNEAAREHLGRQLQGMDAHLERTHAPGEWTARQILCPLLLEPGWKPVTLPIFVGAMFGRHWAGHAEQLASIRRAAGLSEAK